MDDNKIAPCQVKEYKIKMNRSSDEIIIEGSYKNKRDLDIFAWNEIFDTDSVGHITVGDCKFSSKFTKQFKNRYNI